MGLALEESSSSPVDLRKEESPCGDIVEEGGGKGGRWSGNVRPFASLEEAAQRIAVDPESGQTFFVDRPIECNACPFCDDVCDMEWCSDCDERRAQLEEANGPLMMTVSELQCGGVLEANKGGGDKIRRVNSRDMFVAPVLSRRYPRKSTYTLCEVRRRKMTGACWVVCKGVVHDVTAALETHSGGKRSILRNAGGRDCTEDFMFHSKSAKKQWRKYEIGSLVACPGEELNGERTSRTSSDCTIM